MLDPGSVVRESEFATAQNAAGVPDRVRAKYNAVINGEKLATTQRDDFFDRSNKLYSAALDQQVTLEDRFRSQATDLYGLPANAAELIVQDIRATGSVSDIAFSETLNQMSDEQLSNLVSEGLMTTAPVTTQ